MDRFISSYDNATLRQIVRASLPVVTSFVVNKNYKHHKNEEVDHCVLSKDYIYGLMEGEAFIEYSSIIVAKNKLGVVVGAIRITHRNNNPRMLPLVKIFGNEIVNSQQLMLAYHHIWHVGCFVIHQEYSSHGKFCKFVILYAISTIFQSKLGVLLAEAD